MPSLVAIARLGALTTAGWPRVRPPGLARRLTMKWQRRLARLEQIWPAPPPPSKEDLQRQKRWISVVQRLGRLLGQADKLMIGLEREHVGLALDHIVNGSGGPFANWFTNLRD